MRTYLILTLLALAACSGQNSVDRQAGKQADMELKKINRNLELLNQKQGVIAVSGNERETPDNIAENRRIQASISGSIHMIDSVISSTAVRLDTLNRELAGKSRQLADLDQAISDLQLRMETKQAEIDSLKNALKHTKLSVAKISDSIHTVYYMAAPKDSLKQWNITETRGSFLGLVGGSTQLGSKVMLERFTRLNRKKTKAIAVPAEIGHFEFVTPHNQASYSIRPASDSIAPAAQKQNGTRAWLVINNPDEFWAASRILVIQLKN